MSKSKKDNKSIKEANFSDVVHAVRQLDTLQKGSAEYQKQHELTVKYIKAYNSNHDPLHHYSISKTRGFIQEMDQEDKAELKEKGGRNGKR